MIDTKPIFHYSDLELKSMGFDMLEQIEVYRKELSLLQSEMNRREYTQKNVSNTEYKDFDDNISLLKPFSK